MGAGSIVAGHVVIFGVTGDTCHALISCLLLIIKTNKQRAAQSALSAIHSIHFV